MSAQGQALTVARYVGIEQAKDWLYRVSTDVGLPTDLALWRETCRAATVRDYEHNKNLANLLSAWEESFDKAVTDSMDWNDTTVCRAVMTRDIWSGAGLDTPAMFLARKGDIVNVSPSPFRDYPVTVVPRTGPAFCAAHSDLTVIDKVALPSSYVRVREGDSNA